MNSFLNQWVTRLGVSLVGVLPLPTQAGTVHLAPEKTAPSILDVQKSIDIAPPPASSAKISSSYILDRSARAETPAIFPARYEPAFQVERFTTSSLRDPDSDPHALPLPDAVKTFPLGALMVALAIRRMQRRPRRA